MNIENKVCKFIIDKKLLSDNIRRIYVATSGGADSMALLAFMRKNTTREIIAVHVNHGIRGVTADRDERFVKNYCKENNIPCIVFNARKENIAIPEHANEEWARNLRYNFFNTLDMTDAVIATAHTASDQAETALFRIARGCGLNGMLGIKAKRDNFIRPFLCITREETETLTELYGTGYITDESNLTDDYSRNKIRHHIIPVLNEINSNAVLNISKTCNRISNAYDFIHQFAISQLKMCKLPNCQWYNTYLINQNHTSIIDEMLLVILSDFECSDSIAEKARNAIISCDYNAAEYKVFEARVDNNHNIVITNRTVSIKEMNEIQKEIFVGDNSFGSWNHGITVRKCSYQEFLDSTKDKRALAYYLDGDKFPLSRLIMTRKKDGDRFKPACRYRTKVSNHFGTEYMLEKENLPIVRNKSGNILYVHNVGFTDGMLPSESTKTIYKFSSY